MDIKGFLNTVCSEIKYEPVRASISEELKLHIEDIKEEYQFQGMEEKEAEEKAVSQMGAAEEIGKKLNKIHRPKLDWKLFIILIALLCAGFLVTFIRTNSMENENYIIRYLMFTIVRNSIRYNSVLY